MSRIPGARSRVSGMAAVRHWRTLEAEPGRGQPGGTDRLTHAPTGVESTIPPGGPTTMARTTAVADVSTQYGSGPDWVAVARELGPAFAARAPAHDAEDSFVAENYLDLKARKVFSAGVPAEL